MTPKQEGFAAHNDGQPKKANPYPHESRDWQLWLLGWEKARDAKG